MLLKYKMTIGNFTVMFSTNLRMKLNFVSGPFLRVTPSEINSIWDGIHRKRYTFVPGFILSNQ